MTDRTERPLAVVCNPTKISDDLAGIVRDRARDKGWSEPLWIETTADDPGRTAARQALDAGAELIFAAGGDGTVRAVAATVAGSEVPLAIVPAGTAN
ncbi:MAG: acylglycerol kinase family protein, partial [Microlunatus sp.]|nr:acylglycerol kinase family protein [Microlunatus sp.]